MWRNLLILLFLSLAIIVSFFIFFSDPGYVLIRLDHYDIETTVTGMLVLLIVFFLFFFFIGALLKRIFYLRRWFIHRKRRRARKQEKMALIKFLEGDFKKAEKGFMAQIEHAENPVLNYLFSAMATEKQGHHDRTDQHLAQAMKCIEKKQEGKKHTEKNRFTVNIARVRIQLNRGELTQAQEGISLLLKKAPQHPEVLRLAETIFLQTRSYSALLNILPWMRKIRLHPENELQTLEQKVHRNLPASRSRRRFKI